MIDRTPTICNLEDNEKGEESEEGGGGGEKERKNLA